MLWMVFIIVQFFYTMIKRQIELNEWREVVALLSKRIYCIITYRRTQIKKLQRCSFYTIKHKDLGNMKQAQKTTFFVFVVVG